MTPKQQSFITSVVSMDNKKNHSLLEAVVKLYVMNEGVSDFVDYLQRARDKQWDEAEAQAARVGKATDDALGHIGSAGRRIGRKVGSAFTRLSRKLAEDPAAVTISGESYDVSSAAKAVEAERFLHTWEMKYPRMLQALDFIEYYLRNYGNEEIARVINSRDFKESVAIGDEIDRLRPSPMYKEDSRKATFTEMVNGMRTPGNDSTVNTILDMFEESETYTSVIPLNESAEGTNMLVLKNELAVVRNFNAAHGSAPWRRWFNAHKYEFAMGSRKNIPQAPTPAIDDDEED